MTVKKELGSFKGDFEEWFPMWDSVLFYPNPALPENKIPLVGHSGDGGSVPAHRHQTCQGMTKADSPFPPRVCPYCGVDTLKEIKSKEERSLWLPSV